MADLSHHARDLRRDAGLNDAGVRDAGLDDAGVRDALRAGLWFAVTAFTFYFLASVWVSTCTGSIADAAGCGAPQRAMLTLGAPGILLAGCLWSLMRGLRGRREPMAWFGAARAHGVQRRHQSSFASCVGAH